MIRYNRFGSCPKCGSWALTSAYREGAHLNCVTTNVVERISSFYDGMRFFRSGFSVRAVEEDQQYLDELESERAAVPDHIERGCNNCGYRWDEDTLDE